MQSSDSFGKKVDSGGDSLCNLAIGNGYLICVRNVEGHIAPQHTVMNNDDVTMIWHSYLHKRFFSGMASKSMVNLVLAVFVASVIGVTVAYPSNVQDILNSENAENKAKIEQILSHFPPNEQQDDSEDIEVCPLKA